MALLRPSALRWFVATRQPARHLCPTDLLTREVGLPRIFATYCDSAESGLTTPRVCGVFLPLCDFSIPQTTGVVKPFFGLFFYFFWRVLPSPFQRLTGCEFNRLVHIYIPHNRTPCGRGLCHQGLTDSRGSCIPHLFGLSGFALLPSFTS